MSPEMISTINYYGMWRDMTSVVLKALLNSN